MTSHHVMHYMTIDTCLLIIQELKAKEKKRKEKKKKNQIKENR